MKLTFRALALRRRFPIRSRSWLFERWPFVVSFRLDYEADVSRVGPFSKLPVIHCFNRVCCSLWGDDVQILFIFATSCTAFIDLFSYHREVLFRHTLPSMGCIWGRSKIMIKTELSYFKNIFSVKFIRICLRERVRTSISLLPSFTFGVCNKLDHSRYCLPLHL